MSVRIASQAAPPVPAAAALPLPRADVPAPAVLPRRRRGRWNGGGRWPFGPFATVASLVLHGAVVALLLWIYATGGVPEGIGAQVFVAMTPDLGELEERPLVETPEEEPTIEPLDLPEIPELPEVEELPPVEELEELEALPVPDREPGLTLDVVEKRIPPKETPVAAPPSEPAPAVRPPPTPRPAVRPPAPQPSPRPRGATPRGRLRPVYTPIAYPESARQAGLEGRARVVMTIDASGRVVDVELLASSGFPVLDQAALSSARQWRFQPPGTWRRAAQTFRFSLD